MEEKTTIKKDDLFLEEEEPKPEKLPSPKIMPNLILTKSYSQNNVLSQEKINSNIKQKQKSKISKLIGPASINVSHLSRARTTINNIKSSIYENFNVQKQRYDWQKTYLYLHPNINNSFIQRMEFDVYKRQIKEKEIDKLIEENKIKIEEKERNKTFNRLIEDANRRIEAMDNLENMKKILNNNNDITEQPLKKYTDEQWKKIYDERFKTFLEKTKEKKENKLKIILEEKLKKEKDEINLCKVKKASKKHIEKEANKMYKEALKIKMKKEEKLMRLRYNRNKKNKFIFEDEEEYEFTNKKKSNKKKSERTYNFIDDDKLNLKSYDISHCVIDKTSSGIPSIHDGKNLKKLFENSSVSETKKDNNNNITTNKEETNENNKLEGKKNLRLDLFEEAKKENMKQFSELNNKENLNINNNKENKNINIDNNINIDSKKDINNKKDSNKKLYMKEVSYIIDQFFLRNNSGN